MLYFSSHLLNDFNFKVSFSFNLLTTFKPNLFPKCNLCVCELEFHIIQEKRILAIFKNKLNFLCIYSWFGELVLIWIFSPYMSACMGIAPQAQILNPSCKCWVWVLMGGDLEQWISGSGFGDGREGQWAVKSHIPVQWSWNNGIVLWKRGCFSLLHSSPDLQGPDCAVNQQKSVWCKAGREFKRARGDSRGILLSVRKCFSDFKMVAIWKAALVFLQSSEFVVGTSANYIASFVGLTLYCWGGKKVDILQLKGRCPSWSNGEPLYPRSSFLQLAISRQRVSQDCPAKCLALNDSE